MTALLELKGIRRSYPSGDGQVEVLKGITLDIHAGEMVAIVGASGSGKSTLMNILGCLDKPTSGSYRVAGLILQRSMAMRWPGCAGNTSVSSFNAITCCRILRPRRTSKFPPFMQALIVRHVWRGQRSYWRDWD